MNRLLWPTTDAGVAVQVAVVVAIAGVALWRSSHRPELRVLVIGVAVLVLALIGLRAAH